MLIDSHAHLDFSHFEDDRDVVIQRALQNGLVAIVNVGTDLASSQKSVALARHHPQIYAAVGIHPHDATTLTAKVLQAVAKLAEDEKTVAIGEVGLDFYRNLSPRDQQREAFRQQIRLAVDLGLPLVIHDRDAHGEVLQILKNENAQRVGGVLHCFSGSLEVAQEGLEMGFHIAFGGPITYGGGKKEAIACHIPLEKILIETDCPFLTPVPYRGQRNEPAHVRLVAEKLAQLRGITFAEVATATTRNALKLFSVRIENLGGEDEKN